ncbi:hypothetical protein MJO28_000745 [Puccinia striiformis f. sp. tritici]|uniref:Uncharacterized protein n=1 Tax=Puccinia striiformis f. sp. tritici TaxID=168172 RepID=A0ACC0EYS0_9BASI|nr:hypothetical protein MJO28_000745 [Puccinia striiformis f. sp. tritici]
MQLNPANLICQSAPANRNTAPNITYHHRSVLTAVFPGSGALPPTPTTLVTSFAWPTGIN